MEGGGPIEPRAKPVISAGGVLFIRRTGLGARIAVMPPPPPSSQPPPTAQARVRARARSCIAHMHTRAHA